MKLHPFDRPVSPTELPHAFPSPFGHSPHPLCVEAAKLVQAYLERWPAWQELAHEGKMFGVLVVTAPEGMCGFLAAYSGLLGGLNEQEYFVGPIFDLLQPNGHFKQEEARISALNLRISKLQQGEEYTSLCRQLVLQQQEAEEKLAQARRQLKADKERRDRLRQKHTLAESEMQQLIAESQHQKAEYKRLERKLKAEITTTEERLNSLNENITQWKKERRERSAQLQRFLFDSYRVRNAHGEERSLWNLFASVTQQPPPGGAGECAAPKLLNHAYLHGYRPIALAEFWWGSPSPTEVRLPGYFYPACKGKCEPILHFMLQGLCVERSPLLTRLHQCHTPSPLEIIYEDKWMVAVNKPPGMLSVPGKDEDADSVYRWARERYPEASGPLLVHRLDMDTSGVLLLAKSKEVHQLLQAQFISRKVQKCYTALLNGCLSNATEGLISLPLCLNPDDRPRQMVHSQYGKPATTRYRVIHMAHGLTRVEFQPLTGRTHQLRVHAAHPQGLGIPIVGDRLYGQPADRLYLHASSITFAHPMTGKVMQLHCPPPF